MQFTYKGKPCEAVQLPPDGSQLDAAGSVTLAYCLEGAHYSYWLGVGGGVTVWVPELSLMYHAKPGDWLLRVIGTHYGRRILRDGKEIEGEQM